MASMACWCTRLIGIKLIDLVITGLGLV
ncbi:hypothetical protein K931_12589 [Aeromonas salmonicida subsp. pectinolytica 34mel]|nr:hypothetical protein K931_12589 [Aeromonas salmonicida subsp. pectinolytica 34mel]